MYGQCFLGAAVANQADSTLTSKTFFAARACCRGALASRLDLVLLIDARDFGALGRVRSYRGSRTNIDGGTRYLALEL